MSGLLPLKKRLLRSLCRVRGGLSGEILSFLLSHHGLLLPVYQDFSLSASMVAGRKNVLRAAAVAGLCPLVAVTGFSVPVRSGVRAASPGAGTAVYALPSDASLHRKRTHATTTTMVAPGTASGTAGNRGPDFGEMLGDKVASVIVNSPVYPLLINQAKSTMKKSAEVRDLALLHASIIRMIPAPLSVRKCKDCVDNNINTQTTLKFTDIMLGYFDLL